MIDCSLVLFHVLLNDVRKAFSLFGRRIGVAGIAMPFLFFCVSCRSIPQTDTNRSAQSDSVIVEMKSIIERQQIEYSKLEERFREVSSQLETKTESSESEITVIERFDSTGMVTERIRNEKLSNRIQSQLQTINELQAEKTGILAEVGNLRLENDSLRTQIRKMSSEETHTIIEKKVVPQWCFFTVAVCIVFFFIVAGNIFDRD